MFDKYFRQFIDPILNRWIVDRLPRKLEPHHLTLMGFGCGMATCLLIGISSHQKPNILILAFFFWLMNRLCDALDGLLAIRRHQKTKRGAFLDIVCDFIVYAGIVCSFCFYNQDFAIPAAFLITSFVASGSSFLALAIFMPPSVDKHERKSFFHVTGMMEGFETILFLSFMMIIPHMFPTLAWIFGAMCFLTAIHRIWRGWYDLAPTSSPPSTDVFHDQ